MITAQVDACPFKVAAQAIVLKADDRKPVPTGPQITSVSVSTDMPTQNGSPSALVDPNQLKDTDNDFLKEHSAKAAEMWLSTVDSKDGFIEFDLGQIHPLGTILVYNYNNNWKSFYGIRSADISVLGDGDSWRQVYDDYEFQQAEGTNDYDEPAVLTFEGLDARKVRFSDIKPFEGSDHVGLSEVAFYEIPSIEALNPIPQNNGDIASTDKVTLTWTPGWKTKGHEVYLGTSPDEMKRIVTLKDGCEVELTDLTPFSRYYWRVDEVQTDDTVITGPLWQFTTGGLCAYWTLDDVDGNAVADSSEYGRDGTVSDANGLKLVDGKIGKCIDFRGTDKDFIEIKGYPGVTGSAPRTMAAWIKTTCDKGEILTWGSGQMTQKWVFRVNDPGVSVPGTIRIEVQGGFIAGSTKINDGQWHHVAGVFDPNGDPDIDDIRLYVDGKLEERSMFHNGIFNTAADDNVRIGCFRNRPFAGLIDDVQIYSIALSDEQIQGLYEGQMPQPQVASMPTLLTQSQTLTEAKAPADVNEVATPASRSKNLIAVLVVIAIIGVIAVLTRKKKSVSR